MKPAIHGRVNTYNNYMLCVDSIDCMSKKNQPYWIFLFTIVRGGTHSFDPIITFRDAALSLSSVDAHVNGLSVGYGVAVGIST